MANNMVHTGAVAGKVALVTGGASGIGAECARLLASQGASVVVTDLNGEGAMSIAAEIEAAGARAIGLAQDVVDESQWVAVVEKAEATFGKLDILVSNAGICMTGAVTEMSLENWRRQNAINVDGVFLSVKHCIPAMRRAGRGSIILMSSVAGLRGSAGFAGYCASKAAVRFFGKAVALECVGEDIRVNSVHPGVVETPLWSSIEIGGASGRETRKVDHARIGQADAPMGRSGTPAEIAAGVLFLASDASSYMTGAELVFDGGISAGALPKRKA